MPRPRKIATAKPHERPKPFDAWYFTAKAKTIADMPMCTEVLKRVCKDDPVLFDIVNQHLEDAFNAGRKSVMPWPRKIAMFGRGSGRQGPSPETDLELANRLISMARDEWIAANAVEDGTDTVTPYDVWFYKERKL